MPGQRVDGAARYAATPQSTLVVVGNFDGVHRGHQLVLNRATAQARESRLAPVLLTFDPHPATVLGKGQRPVLTCLDRKVQLMQAHSPELTIVVEPFTQRLSLLTAREFAARLLVEQLGAARVLVGQNFRFGHGREGDPQRLHELGQELGFRAEAQQLEKDGDEPISSTRIRRCLEAGQVEAASALLGRPHSVSGRVCHGDGRARGLGVPSANLGEVAEQLPARGVYAVRVDVLTPNGAYESLGQGLANVGIRPTLGAGQLRAEVHLLEFSGDLYGRCLRMHFICRLRDEQRFETQDELLRQLSQDKVQTAQALARDGAVARPGQAWY